MKRWLRAQPIHRKLVITSMAKTTAVLFAAMVILLVVDAVRFRRNVAASAAALAAIAAENIRVAVALESPAEAAETLDTLRLQPSVARVCAYRSNGTLFAQYARDAASGCDPTATLTVPWSIIGGVSPVQHFGETVGHVYVELTWAALRTRLVTAGVTSFVVLLVAAGLMFVLSSRLHGRISGPIMQLAAAARRMGQAEDFQLPPIAADEDEVGDLVKAFGAMVGRVRTANQSLTASNDALRRENEERRLIEARYEVLLVREREANRIKDEFLATVSHELRTPLNAIVGWARILISAPPDPATVSKAAASLHRNALAQSRVIDDLIDISRIVTGKLRVTTESVDLRSVVESTVDAIRPAAEHARVTLRVQLPATPCVINGDRDRLQQVVSNLLSNAVKFAAGGTVRISLTTDASHLRLVVEDDGQGIPPEFLAHVFDRFRQADASTTREHGGLGIGLAIAKELVEMHGGSIQASSLGRGCGARFEVEFPWAPRALPADRLEEGVPSLDGVSVLAVDDNADALDLLDTVLSKAGATVRVAASGSEALALWQRAPSDVLLCDLAMPRMGGFELLDKIRELDRQAGRVTPAIAVTAHATEEQRTRSAQAGFQLHMAKPLDTNRLIRAVSAVRSLV